MKRVFKWDVEVDDVIHLIGTGKVVHAASQFGDRDRVQVWTEEECDEQGRMKYPADRAVLIVGTGHAVPDLMEHVGSVIPLSAGGHLVWHLYGGV